MIVFIEGPDNVGKGTQILNIQKMLLDKPLHVLHYMSIKGFDSSNEIRDYSRRMYNNMFGILYTHYRTNHFILDRSHIGEAVYSPMYRDYTGEYVFDIEKIFITKNDRFKDYVYLITFIDEPENLINRDDGLSFTIDAEKKKQEIDLFVRATNRSIIPRKKIININNKNEDEVFDIVYNFLIS